MQGISWLANDLLAPQEGLCPLDFVIICSFSHHTTEPSVHEPGRNLVPNIYHVIANGKPI